MQLSSNGDISREASHYFWALFTEDSLPAHEEEISILSCISSMVSLEMNDALIQLTMLQELEDVVFHMKKGKASGLDGFPIQFFQDFWEIIKFYLLEVVESSRRNKKMLRALNSTFISLIPKKAGANKLN